MIVIVWAFCLLKVQINLNAVLIFGQDVIVFIKKRGGLGCGALIFINGNKNE